ncbi:DUF6894 family protein [Microvirga yunnanensis]|uniref:DUF6894 family protein n=1 Tax=Microvirga yunnanensis TaxID=2953740 RepID=UPI0021C8FF9A|nr:hypothetical protein [Microvirga sp. HBU67655]
MTRYYFHLRTAQGLSPDELGLDLPDVETAYLEAFTTAQEMWPDLLRRREDPTRYTFEIADRFGQVVQTLPFAEVLDSARGRATRRSLPRAARTAQELADRTRHLAAAVDEQVRQVGESLRLSRDLLRAPAPAQPGLGPPTEPNRMPGRDP